MVAWLGALNGTILEPHVLWKKVYQFGEKNMLTLKVM
jgi:hypothetical protein